MSIKPAIWALPYHDPLKQLDVQSHTTYGNSGSSSTSVKGDAERDFFVELWDISGHERYKDCRSLFYSQINVNGELKADMEVALNPEESWSVVLGKKDFKRIVWRKGVMFVYDRSQRRTKASLQKWAVEVAATGTFSAPLGSGGPGGLPVPYIVIGNKADIATEGARVSSGNLVDVARQWVEKQGLLPSSEELPLTESFPASGALVAILVERNAAKEARFDKEAIAKFFRMLIRRRYFSDELPALNHWSMAPAQNSFHRSGESVRGEISDDDQFYKLTGTGASSDSSIYSDSYKYNALPPLPAQRNLTPPPTLYPQQPVSIAESYSLPRFVTAMSADSGNGKSKRADINV
ncbi:hypothetical protein ACLOJK_019802 [Asimina triloba]